MKKLLLIVVVAAGGSQLKAQQLTPVKPFDNLLSPQSNNFVQPGIQLKQLQAGPELLASLNQTNTSLNTNAYLTIMPVAVLNGNSKMPVVKLEGNSKMPVVNLDNADQSPAAFFPAVKYPVVPIAPVQKY